jgi:hypothetical protein
MRLRYVILLAAISIQTANAFWIGAAVRGVKSIKNQLTESKTVESTPTTSKTVESINQTKSISTQK